MLRIISGSLKGKKLYTLPGKTIRPTSDRIRESIFNILSKYPRPRWVLDLFAGTGAMGIEAVSRGAGFTVFVENHPKSILVLQKNIDACLPADRSKLIKGDIRKNLNCLDTFPEPFDLVFMDPPYNQNLISVTLSHLLNSAVLSNDSIIVVEHAVSEPLPDLIDFPSVSVIDQRRYGQTFVSFISRMG